MDFGSISWLLVVIHNYHPFCDDLPPLSSKPTYQFIKDNLQALHRAREAIIASENSDHIRGALTHNIRTTGEIKYLTGENVYYKRAANRE